jgi:peptidyl-prolyl cis-trans isomerase D
MLDAIRKNAQSWIVKALFAIIVLVFVFWGVGGFRGQEKSILATVNETPIETKAFFMAYDQERQRLRKQQPDITQETLERIDLKGQVFKKMVNNLLLLDLAHKIGLFVSVDELRKKITTMKVFQDTNHTFDANRYQAILQANNLSPNQFENNMQQDLLLQKMQDLLLTPVDQENISKAKDFFSFLQEKVSMQYVLFDWHEYLDQVSITPDESKQFYDEHQEDFRQEAQIQIKYLLLTPETLSSSVEIDPLEIKKYYTNHQDQFKREEKVKARHILLKLNNNATQQEINATQKKIAHLKELLEKGQDFTELAKNHSEGPSASQGGDLGWFGRGSMTPPFEKAAFALKEGQISDPVKTRFGFHLIKVDKRQEPGISPFEEVKQKIKDQLRKDKATDQLEDSLDQALEILTTTGDLKQAATHSGLELKTSGLFTRNSGPKDLALPQEAQDTLFSLNKGEITDYPIFVDNGYLLAEKTQEKESHIKDFEQVTTEIERQLKEEKAQEAARQAAQTFLDKSKATEQEINPPKQFQIQTSAPFSRQGFIPGLGVNKELAHDCFSTQSHDWLSQVYQVSQGYLVAKLKERISPDAEIWEQQKSMWIANITQRTKQEFLQAILQGLRDKANITINAPNVLEYQTG